MPEGLLTASGKPVDLDAEFARAMATPDSSEPTAEKPPKAERGSGTSSSPKPRRARTDKPRVAAATPKPSTLTPQALAKQRTDGVKGLVQVTSVLPLMAYQRTGKKAFLADVVCLTSSADALADACVSTAAVSPSFAKLLDQVTNVGPYAALVGVAVSIGAQLALNHGSPIGKALGATDPAELIAQFEAQQEKATDASDAPGAV